MPWGELFERQQRRYEDGLARSEPGQKLRLGNVSYSAALALLMLDRGVDAATWFDRAGGHWHESLLPPLRTRGGDRSAR